MENPQTDFVLWVFCETDYDILILNLKRMEELSNAGNFIVLRNQCNGGDSMFPKVVQVIPMKDYSVYVYFEKAV